MCSGAEGKVGSLPQGSDPHVSETGLLVKSCTKKLSCSAHVMLLFDRMFNWGRFSDSIVSSSSGIEGSVSSWTPLPSACSGQLL